MGIKKQLREQMRGMLVTIDPMSRYARSLAACKHLTALPEFIAADTIMLFLSMPDEVDTSPIALAAWRAGKTVVAPKAVWESRKLLPVEIKSLDTDITTGRHGVPEPAEGGSPVPVEMIDFIVVPGLAFDASGNRLGRGGGFYDKLLASPRCRAVKCALAFHEQIMETIPVEPHDAPVDRIVTDEDVLTCDIKGG